VQPNESYESRTSKGTDLGRSTGETMGLSNLFGLFSQIGQKPRLLRSRLATFEDIKHGNTTLLGGNQSWSGRVFLNPEGFRFQASVILNKNPRPGEKSLYKPEFDPVNNQLTRDYAIVLMLPNEKRQIASCSSTVSILRVLKRPSNS